MEEQGMVRGQYGVEAQPVVVHGSDEVLEVQVRICRILPDWGDDFSRF